MNNCTYMQAKSKPITAVAKAMRHDWLNQGRVSSFTLASTISAYKGSESRLGTNQEASR